MPLPLLPVSELFRPASCLCLTDKAVQNLFQGLLHQPGRDIPAIEVLVIYGADMEENTVQCEVRGIPVNGIWR